MGYNPASASSGGGVGGGWRDLTPTGMFRDVTMTDANVWKECISVSAMAGAITEVFNTGIHPVEVRLTLDGVVMDTFKTGGDANSQGGVFIGLGVFDENKMPTLPPLLFSDSCKIEIKYSLAQPVTWSVRTF